MRLEVRCCCDAGRLLGTIEVPDEYAESGMKIIYPLQAPCALLSKPGEIEKVMLEVSKVYGIDHGPDMPARLAVKSNHAPLESLRRIASFKEA